MSYMRLLMIRTHFLSLAKHKFLDLTQRTSQLQSTQRPQIRRAESQAVSVYAV